jgi:Tat protein translocase TatB subunit
MLGIGMGELLVIFAVALLVMGPGDLPKLARMLGRTLRYARKSLKQFTDAVDLNDEIRELKETGEILRDTVKDIKEDKT